MKKGPSLKTTTISALVFAALLQGGCSSTKTDQIPDSDTPSSLSSDKPVPEKSSGARTALKAAQGEVKSYLRDLWEILNPNYQQK